MIKALNSYKESPYYAKEQNRENYNKQYKQKDGWDWDQYKQSNVNPDGSNANISDIGLSFNSVDEISTNQKISNESQGYNGLSNIREVENEKPAFNVRSNGKSNKNCLAQYFYASYSIGNGEGELSEKIFGNPSMKAITKYEDNSNKVKVKKLFNLKKDLLSSELKGKRGKKIQGKLDS